MLRRSVFEKIVAVFSIITLTFANTAFTTKAYATTIFESVFFNNLNTEEDNVVFNAYFQTEKEKSYSVISAVQKNATDLVIDLKVQEAGYLKNPKIQIKPIDEKSSLSFEINESFEENDYIKFYEENTISLKQVNTNSQIYLQVPLHYIQKEYTTKDQISNQFKLELTGIYVNDKGKEIEISKTQNLCINWEDEKELELSSEITKYVPFELENENGIVLQTKVKLNINSEKALPVETSKLEIEIPKLENAILEKIEVIPKQLNITSNNEMKFSKENWEYDENILKITTKNIPNNENEYYSSPGIEEYLITYIYKNSNKLDENLKTEIKATITTLEKTEKQTEITKEFEYQISEQINNIVTLEVDNQTQTVSKGNMYLNYNNPEKLHETEYISKQIIDISYKDLIEEIIIEDTTNNYITKKNEILNNDDLYYKQIEISKVDFEKILGEEGSVEIQNQNGAVIAKFTKATLPDENENYTYSFENEDTKNIIIKLSKPISEGNITITNIKAQKQTTYNKLEFKEFDYLITNSKLKTKYKHLENIIESSNIETKIKLEDTITKANLDLSTNKFSIIEPTDVEFKIKLNNNTNKSDIYGKSIFEIILPEYVENFEIKDYNMLYGDGLNIESVEKSYNDSGGLTIIATIEGLQTDISSGSFTNGTNIIINGEVSVNENSPIGENNLVLTYTNNEATNYYEEGKATNKIIITSFISASKLETTELSSLPDEIKPDEKEDVEEVFNVEENENNETENVSKLEQNQTDENLNLIQEETKYKIEGTVWIDKNSDGIQNENEETKSDVKVILVDTGQAEQTAYTDSGGKYEFTDLENKAYTVIFEYDSTEYSLTSFKNNTSENNSKVIYSEIELDGEKFDGGVTDVIEIQDSNITNINMGLVENKNFDLQLTKTVSKITIQNEDETEVIEYKDTKLAKAQIDSKNLQNSSAYIEYILKIENKGDVEGYAKSIVDYIPQDLEFNPALNPDWYQDEDGNIYTDVLEDKSIPVGEEEKLKLILTKKLNEENTGITNTSAEIVETYNVYGLENKNLKAPNNIENNSSSADVVISVKKGEVFIYTSIISTTILLSGIVIFLIIYRLKFLKRKEGGV